MWEKIMHLFDARTSNKCINVLLGLMISVIISWSLSQLIYSGLNQSFTVMVALVLWIPIMIGELKKPKDKEHK